MFEITPFFSYKTPTICNKFFNREFFARPPTNTRVFPISELIFIGNGATPLPSLGTVSLSSYFFFLAGIPKVKLLGWAVVAGSAAYQVVSECPGNARLVVQYKKEVVQIG